MQHTSESEPRACFRVLILTFFLYKLLCACWEYIGLPQLLNKDSHTHKTRRKKKAARTRGLTHNLFTESFNFVCFAVCVLSNSRACHVLKPHHTPNNAQLVIG